MKTCPSCKITQESGNFCEICGQPLINLPIQSDQDVIPNSQTEQVSAISDQQVNSHPNVNQVGAKSKSFLHYAFNRFKQPNLSLTDSEQTFSHTFISFLLLPFFMSTFIFVLINNLYKRNLAGLFSNGDSLPFFNLTSRIFVIFLLLLLPGYLATLVTVKIARNKVSSKQLFIKYFGLQVPFMLIFAVLTALSLLGIISIDPYRSENAIWIFFVFTLVINLTMLIHPFIVTFYQLSLQKHKQGYYFIILSFIFNLLFTALVYVLIYESLIYDFINMIDIL